MNRAEISEYHKILSEILKSEPDAAKRREFLAFERTTDQYNFAKEQARRRNASLMQNARATEVLSNIEEQTSQTERVAGNSLAELGTPERELTPQEQTILWANQVLEQFNGMPQRNNAERRKASNLALQTARRLLENPQEIDTAASIWKSRETNTDDKQDGEKNQTTQSFYTLVKQEVSRDIRKNWENISPEQLAQLIKTYANNALIQDLAQEILTGYSRGPNDRRERVDYFYNLTRATIRLIEDQKAFVEAAKIGLFHNEDILPRRRNLLERGRIISIPWDVEEKELIKWLRVDHVAVQLSFAYPEDLRPLVEENNNFLRSSEAKEFFDKEGEKAVGKLGYEEAETLHQIMSEYSRRGGLRVFNRSNIELPWPESVIHDRNDPLTKEYGDTVLEKVHFEQAKQSLVKIAADEDNAESEQLEISHFVLPNGLIVDVFIPNKLTPDVRIYRCSYLQV